MRRPSVATLFIRLGCQVGVVLMVTTVAVYLDLHLGTRPWITLIAVGIGVTIASTLVVRRTYESYSQLDLKRHSETDDEKEGKI